MNKLKEEHRSCPLIMQRWADLIVLSIISALGFVILHPAIVRLHCKLNDWFPPSKIFLGFSPIILILFLLITTFIWLFLIRLGGFRYRNLFPNKILQSFRRGSLYPPTWISGFLGAILSYWFNFLLWDSVPFDWTVIGLSIASFLPGICTASFLDSLFSLTKSSVIQPTQTIVDGKPVKSFRALLQDQTAFTSWFNKEIPIQSSDEDLFDLTIFAKRITTTLLETPLKTIAIVGSYGCGKSSIINMIEEFLKKPERLRSISGEEFFNAENILSSRVQGWGLHKNAAAEHILRSIITELSKSADCLGLSYIPTAYQAVLSNSGSSWLKSFAVLSSAAREPLDILRKLDTVLACTGERMVIFLEDLDRNLIGSGYWKELSSLLDRLKDLDNITFVLAINQNSKTYDILIRICEHIEFIPTLPRREVMGCMKFFRDLCLDRFSASDIDCRTREERDKHIGLEEGSVEYDIAAMLGHEADDPISVATRITDNPRALKSILRHTWHSWQSLHGEIDFDDLFVANVIYIVAPEAFAFMNKHTSILRSLNERSGSNAHSRERNEETRKKLDTAWQDIKETWDAESVKMLIIFLFPGWIKDDFYSVTVPQGVLHSFPTDYWIRLNRGELAQDEIPDQIVLHALQDWKRNHDQAVYLGLNLPETIFQVAGFAAIFERYGKTLNGQEILSLAGEVFELIRKKGESLTKGANYYGFIELWRLSLDQPVPEHDDWVLAEIRKTVPISLRFANELYYYWRNRDHLMVSSKNKTLALRNGFVEAARQAYENNSQILIDALNPGYMYDIHHLMIYYSEPDGGGPGFDPAEWKWLANVLLEAGKTNPQVIIPQLACLLSNEASHPLEGFSYSLHEERLNSLFGEEKSAVLKLLANEIDTSMFDERDRNRIEYVRLEAAGRIR